MPPKKRKIKREEGADPQPDPAASSSNSAAVPDPASSSSNNAVVPDAAASLSSAGGPVPKLYEFKFTSMPFGEFDSSSPHALEFKLNLAELSGCFHIPMLIDEESGVLSIPPGDSDVKGWIDWPLDEFGNHIRQQLHAKLVPNKNRWQSHDLPMLRLGYTRTENDVYLKQFDWSQVQNDAPLKHEIISYNRDMVKLAANAGGALTFRCGTFGVDNVRFDQVLDLYTVISEQRPNQPSVLENGNASSNDWDRLERMANKNPRLTKFKDKKAIITEYQRFLALHITSKNEDSSEEFAPSPEVDRVW